MPLSQQLKQKLLQHRASQVQLLSLSLRNQLNQLNLLSLSLRNQLNLLSQRQTHLDQLLSQSQAKQVLPLNKNLNSHPNL